MNGSRVVAALLCCAPLLALSPSPRPVEAAPHLVRKLPNKMTVVVRENRTRPLVSVQAWILSGQRDEGRSEAGAAAALSKTMLIATKAREPGIIERDLASLAATFVSDVGYSHMSFGLTLPARSLEAGLEILGDVVTNPRFADQDAVQGIAGSRLESTGRLSVPEATSVNAARQALHPDSPLGGPIYPTDAQLAALNLTTIRRFYEKHVVAQNVIIVIVGDVDPEDAVQRTEKAFAKLSTGRAPSHPRVKDKSMKDLRVVSEPAPGSTSGSALTVAFRGPSWGTADAIALDVLLAVVADAPTSRLRRRLDAGGAFLAAGSGSAFDADGGTIAISVSIRPDQARDAENALLAEIAQARSSPVAPEELDAALHYVLGRDLGAATELSGLARATALGFLMGTPGQDEVYFDRLKAVRTEDLLAVATKYFDWKQAAVVETAPPALADSFRIWNDFDKRIRERVQMHEAAYRTDKKVPMSRDSDRAARIDAPLRSIPATPFDAGRSRVETIASSPNADLGDLRVLASEDRSAPLVTVGIYLSGGVRYESDRNNGVSALLRETLLSTEDPKAEGLTYRESLGALGGLVPYSDRDLWGISVTVPAEDWKYALGRLGAMFSAPHVDSTAVDLARLTLIDALSRWLRDENTQRAQLIFPTKYVVSGYRLPPLGTRKTVLTTPYDEVDAWYRKFAVRSDMVVAVFGDVRPAEIGPAVAEAFRGVSSAKFRPGPVPQEPPFDGFREKWELGAGLRSTVTLAFNGPRASSPDVPVFYVINSVLSGPKGWFKEWVLSQPAIVEASSYVAHAMDECPIVATVTTEAPAQEESAVNLLFRQFKKTAFYPLEGPDAPLLRQAKDHAVSSYLVRFNSCPARALHHARYELMGLGGTDYPIILAAKMESTVASDLLRVGTKYFEIDQFAKQPYAIAETRPGGW